MSYEEEYAKGHTEGFLIGRAEVFVGILESKALPDWTEKETAELVLGNENLTEYLKEIRTVLARYRGYSEEHKAKKVLYECTYLPYRMPERKKRQPEERAETDCEKSRTEGPEGEN